MNILKKIASYALVALGCSIGAAAQQDVITTVVGHGPNAIPGTAANLYYPYTLAADSAGNQYFSSSYKNQVFKISTTGTITLIAGVGTAGYNGDGIQATTAELNQPTGIAVDGASPANVYFSEFSNCLVRKVDGATGVISTVAGLIIHPTTGNPYPQCGYNGLGSTANATQLNGPQDVAYNLSSSSLYITDYYSGRLLKVTDASPTGAISQVVGGGGNNGVQSNCGGSPSYGIGGAAADAYLCYPQDVTLDTSVTPANVFITESSSGGHCDVLEIVGATSKIYQVAGDYTCGFTDGVKATSANLNNPWQVITSVSGSTTTVTVADYGNNRVRKFALTYSANVPVPGTISTIAGSGNGGFCGDGGGALDACMYPIGLHYDSSGNLYFSDYSNDRIRKVTKTSGDVSTIAGWGPNGGTEPNYSDPIGIPTSATGNDISLYQPYGVYADPASTHVFVSAYDSYAVYRYNSESLALVDIAGNGAGGFEGDGTTANGSGVELNQPTASVLDSKGNLYISDQSNCVVREVEASTGFINTIAGGSTGHENGCGFSGNGGPATNAQLSYPEGLAVDGANNLYIGEYYNCDVRKVSLTSGTITTVAGDPALGCGYTGDGGPATAAELRNILGVAVDGAGNIYISAGNDQRVRKVTAATGIISTFAGTGVAGYNGDGVATTISLYNPQEISADFNGNVFIADESNQLIRWVEPGGQLITIAGTEQTAGYGGDGGLATSALLYNPSGVTTDSSGNTYIADYQNGLVRKISAFAGYGRSVNSLGFDTQPTGTTSGFLPITLSAVGPVTFSGMTISTGFSEVDDCVGITLAARETCEVDVYFSPTAPGVYRGSLKISSNAFFAANADSIALTGTGGGLSVSGSLAFGDQLINTTVSKSVTITNNGSAIKVSSIGLDLPTYFKITANTCPAAGGTFAAAASCSITVSFDPTAIGTKRDTLVVVTTDPSSPLLIPATGTGTEVKLSATSIAFGSIPDRNTVTEDITVTNTGTASLTISTALSGSGASEFAVATTSANTCKSAVAAGKSCTLPVIFNPSSVGTFAASLTLTTNGGSNPVIALSGTSTTDVELSSTSISFATITHGTNETTDLTITNLSTVSLTVSPAFSGTGAAAFKIGSGNTCSSNIPGGGHCTLPVEFAPAAAEAYAATLTLSTDGGTNPTVALKGTGK